jgi:ubiquinone/menaquinone biosynthesis C-methylase UbiE
MVTNASGLPEKLAVSGVVEVSRAVGLIQGGHVLDVATGDGDFIGTLTKALGGFERFTGVDIDTGVLRKAQDTFSGSSVEFHDMDATSLTFEDGTFDTVAMANSLHHMSSVEDALEEMVRVLGTGGNLLITEPFCDGDQSEAQRTEIANHHWSAGVDMALGKYHRHTYTRKEVLSLVEGLGLEQLVVLETSRPLSCLYCENAVRCEDPFDEMMTTRALRGIEEDLERLKACTDEQAARPLHDAAGALRARVKQRGILPASSLYVIGRS